MIATQNTIQIFKRNAFTKLVTYVVILKYIYGPELKPLGIVQTIAD